MASLKPTSVTADSPNPETGRRSFIWKAGAAMSAVLASAVTGMSRPKLDLDATNKNQLDHLSNRIGSLEDANAIRVLHQLFQSRLDQGLYEEVAGMFADDAEVVYNGGLFKERDGIRRLYCDHFASGRTGRRIEPAPGFGAHAAQQLEIVEVAADRKTATGQFPYSIQVGAPMTGESSLFEMARLQGGGIVNWWESGIYKASYVNYGSAWTISKLEYHVNAKADYKPGRSYAKPIEVPAFSSIFPHDPIGPDRLV